MLNAPFEVGEWINGNKERWKALCEQAEVEKHLAKLHELIKEINRLLDENEASLRAVHRRSNMRAVRRLSQVFSAEFFGQ
jgi:hypothetical protein